MVSMHAESSTPSPTHRYDEGKVAAQWWRHLMGRVVRQSLDMRKRQPRLKDPHPR